jgi:predicted nucleic-acid-binding protein
MKIGLDTSVVVRLLTGEPDAQARLALKEVDQLTRSGSSLVVSDLVVAEVYFALQHHYGVPKHEALRSIEQFLSKSGVKAMGAAATVLGLRNLATAEPGFVDRLIHAEYMQSAKEVLTFERTGGRLPGVRVLTAS